MTDDHDEVRCQAMAEADLENLVVGVPRTCCVCADHGCMEARTERQKHPSYEGNIPAISEKEKRGKRIKILKSEIYVQELTTNASINIPTSN